MAGRPRIALAAALGTALAGCVETGDFGRVKPSVWNDAVAATGSFAAAARREPISSLLVTDEEAVLRDRAWRYLVPAHDRAWFDTVLAELVATRILPASAAAPDRAAYHAALLASAERSPTPLYRRLSEDISADMRLLPAFAQAAARVLAADRVRLKILGRLPDATIGEAADVQARVIENRCLVSWVISATEFRTASYAFALQRLAIGSPQHDAVPVERTLERFVAAKSGLAALGVGPIPVACAPDGALAPPPVPVVAKG